MPIRTGLQPSPTDRRLPAAVETRLLPHRRGARQRAQALAQAHGLSVAWTVPGRLSAHRGSRRRSVAPRQPRVTALTGGIGDRIDVLAAGCSSTVPAASGPGSGGDPVRVVIGEDEALLREGLALMLGRAGIEIVGMAASADELLRAVAARPARPRHHRHPHAARPQPTTACGRRLTIRSAHPATAVLVLSQHVQRRYALELRLGRGPRRRLPAQAARGRRRTTFPARRAPGRRRRDRPRPRGRRGLLDRSHRPPSTASPLASERSSR